MRLFTLLVVCIFISSALAAQQKGNILIGGAIGFTKDNQDDGVNHYSQTTFTLRPSIGKFYQNNRMAGISMSYNVSKFEDSVSSRSIGLGVFLRQYLPLGKSFFLFAEEGINGYARKYNYAYSFPVQYEVKERSASFNFYPGLAYAVNTRFHLELAFPNCL